MRRLIVVGIVTSIVSAEVAAADAPIDGEPRVTLVQGKLDGATATLKARYLVRFDRSTFGRHAATIVLPSTASVVRAVASVGGTEHRLELLDANRAGLAFDAIAGREHGPARRWAVLVEGTGNLGMVQVSFAAARGSHVTLELELHLPTCFFRDTRYVSVPAAWRPVLALALRQLSAKPDELADACGGSGDPEDLWIGFASRELASRPAIKDRIGAFAGRIALGDSHIARAELAIAGTLAEVPRDLATVILVDGSRSMSADERELQRALVAAYLRKAPDSRVQVIAYTRTARPLLPGWTAAPQAGPRIERELKQLVAVNGSNVDAGLALASRWLGQITGTRRIVVVTDDRLAKRLTANSAKLRELVPAGTLIHVVVVDPYGSSPVRDDATHLAPLAAATEGLAIHTGLPAGGLDLTLLVRPLTVDRIRIKTPGWRTRRESSCVDQLPAGGSCIWWGEGDAVAGPIAIEGFIWGHRVVRVLEPDLARATSLARELSHFHSLERALIEPVELAARAVNTRWALYAEWGGPGGYSDAFGTISGSCCGPGGGGRTGSGGFVRMGPTQPHPPLDLKPQLAAAVGACSLGRTIVDADVENTLDEIVAVTVTLHPVDPMSEGHRHVLQTCVEDAIWSAALVVPRHFPHELTRVAFGR